MDLYSRQLEEENCWPESGEGSTENVAQKVHHGDLRKGIATFFLCLHCSGVKGVLSLKQRAAEEILLTQQLELKKHTSLGTSGAMPDYIWYNTMKQVYYRIN